MERKKAFNREHGTSNNDGAVIKSDNGEAGFGIGLKLIEKLSRKLNWTYQPAFTDNGYSVTLKMHEVGEKP